MGETTIGGLDPHLASVNFFSDVTPDGPSSWRSCGIYVRSTEVPLGDAEAGKPIPPDFLTTSRCFNCGAVDHNVSGCPLPLDRNLISLSRQLFNFYQAERGQGDFQRVHVIEEWRRQRIEWLDTFQPGEVRSELLQDAIYPGDGDWLKNIAIWGYPKGWVAETNPTETVRRIIENEHVEHALDDASDDIFFVFGDGQVEEITLNTGINTAPDYSEDDDSDDASVTSSILSSSRITTPAATEPLPPGPSRWAQYPLTEFASHILPVYNGFMLPSISHRAGLTYTTDRHILWQRITSGIDGSSTLPQLPPWRQPDCEAYLSPMDAIMPPPPPTTEPPPLPPSVEPLPPAPEPPHSVHSYPWTTRVVDRRDSSPIPSHEDEDMDISE